jgi:hypothetical protein
VGGYNEYLILTAKESYKEASVRIKESLFAFRYEPIEDFLKINVSKRTYEKITAELCEDANELILAWLGNNLKKFIDYVIKTDGCGQCISYYDGQEEEINYNGKYFYVYRLN